MENARFGPKQIAFVIAECVWAASAMQRKAAVDDRAFPAESNFFN